MYPPGSFRAKRWHLENFSRNFPNPKMNIGRSTLVRLPKGVSLLKNVSQARYSSALHTPPIQRVGIPVSTYIPPRYSRLPSPLSSPGQFFRCLLRRIGLVGMNTYHVFEFRKTGKPDFLRWKNAAIESYVRVNKAFAQRKLSSVKSEMSTFVLKALEDRAKTMPKDVVFDWRLLKFKSKPKLVSFQNFPNTDGSTLCLQVVYRFDTTQRLVSVKDGKANTQDRDLMEYVGFNIDPLSGAVCIAGSLFESSTKVKLNDFNSQPSQVEVLHNMALHGDIYRKEP